MLEVLRKKYKKFNKIMKSGRLHKVWKNSILPKKTVIPSN